MKFFAVHVSDLETEAFMSASGDQIATWLFLHAYCSKQENGGIVEGAKDMTAKFWGRHGIDKAIVDTECPLWRWEDDKLVVEPYDIEGEALALKKAAGGKEGASRRWGKRDGTPTSSPDGSPNAPYPIQSNPNQSDPNQSDPTPPEQTKENPIQSDTNDNTEPDGGEDGNFFDSLGGIGGTDGVGGDEDKVPHQFYWESWQLTGVVNGFNEAETRESYEVAKAQKFRDLKGNPIKNPTMWVKNYINGRRSGKIPAPKKPKNNGSCLRPTNESTPRRPLWD